MLQKIIDKYNIVVSVCLPCLKGFVYSFVTHHRLPCLKEIPLLGEMSRSDKRVAVPARKGDHDSGGGIQLQKTLMYLFF